MSSKPAERHTHWRRPRSLTARLTLWYTLATLLILTLAVGALYWALMSSLERDDNQFLADKVQVLQQILDMPAKNADALHEEVEWEGGVGKDKRYYVRILDRAGGVFRMTSGMQALGVPARAFPAPPASARRWCNARGHCYLLLSAWAGAAPGRYRLELLLDVSHEDRLLAEYAHVLAGVLFAGTALAAAVGFIATRRGLRPLKDIIRAARSTSALQLHQRLRPARWPTEFADLGAAFDSMLERLEAGFERLTQFSTELAHELRTPVNNLMGELEVALSRPRAAEEYRRVLESSLEECARLAAMSERLLFLARAGDAAPAVEKQPLDGRAEIEAVCEYFEALAEEKGVTLVREGHAAVRADSVLLRRALGNLLSNAVQYTPGGGRVEVVLAPGGDGGALIRVTDTGIGISAQDQTRVFDRFYRSEAARRLYPQGTGLGLAIVQSIMRLHGGSVSLAPAAGGGTVAILEFPAV